MTVIKNLQILLLALVFIAFAAIAIAEVPLLINYQGRLTDNTGEPVEDDDYQIKFIIYGSESEPDSLWSSGFHDVSVTDGLFSYLLGAIIPLPDSIFDSPNLYLGISVGTDPEISRRTLLTSSAFAFKALKSDTTDYAKDIADLSVTQEKIADDAIYSAHIQDNSILTEDIGQEEITGDNIMNESITTDDIQNGSVYTPDIANGTILDTDISNSAAIEISKIDGTAVNLISTQLVTGTKTFDDLNISTSTRRLALSHVAFIPHTNTVSYYRYIGYMSLGGGNLTASFLAQVSLPDGAVVTQLEGNFYDSVETDNCYIELYRVDINGGFDEMAAANTSGSPGYMTIEDNSIVYAVIDNELYNYVVRIWLRYSTVAANSRLHGAEIEYTITKPLP